MVVGLDPQHTEAVKHTGWQGSARVSVCVCVVVRACLPACLRAMLACVCVGRMFDGVPPSVSICKSTAMARFCLQCCMNVTGIM